MLPEGRKRDGRPVWEPPAMDYSEMIDQEEYGKRRKLLMKHYKNNVAKVTKFEDQDVKRHLSEYKWWASGEAVFATWKPGQNHAFCSCRKS